jgi:hypothetical protein|tara:strand:- start:554 stop:1474 length:921 start_codon:yes stop_codon:yes gene_type:complete
MCLIIQATKPEVITENMMNCAYLNNDDGFGLMFANKGKVHVHKLGKPKSFKSINKLWDSYKNLDVPMGLHFRFNTNGESSKAMSHPYQVLTKEESNRDIWLMHNGPQLPTPMIDSNKSDTHQFVKWILRPQLINEPELLYNPDWQEMLSDMIGSDKLLFLDSKTEEFTIINEEQGKTTDDMWLSNTYSLEPRGNYALSRDYKYDEDTDTLKKIENKWTYEDDDWGYGGMGHYSGTPIYRRGIESNNTTKNYVNPPRDIHENGTDIDENDFYGMTSEEIYDLIIENPTGTAKWVNDLVYNMEVKEGK